MPAVAGAGIDELEDTWHHCAHTLAPILYSKLSITGYAQPDRGVGNVL
jgi:hypothetical protein